MQTVTLLANITSFIDEESIKGKSHITPFLLRAMCLINMYQGVFAEVLGRESILNVGNESL